ncbi:MAG TPA: type II secretion system F family protein [Actinomycetes bacterium]|jgi:tight adherence protein C|nr:type II secretion system F family protein [Actinomycetes bacterium]
MSQVAAALVSLLLVIGLALIASAAPRLRRPRLPARLDPYLRGLEPRRTSLLHEEQPPLTPFPALEGVLRPVFEEGARIAERWLGGSPGVARRLRQAGLHESLPRFRAEQVLWSLGGFGAATSVAVLLPILMGRRPPAVAVLGGAALGLLAGALGRDWRLTGQVERRQARMLGELPTLADLICLAVTAGEAPRAAIERAVGRARGELSRELELVLADLRAGLPFTTAMERLAARVPVPQVVRLVDGVVVAVERGTPLADVLRTQAADIREQRKRELIQAGGRREIFMLVPVVFLIMPVIVLFALYPGVFSLSQIAR